VPGIVVQASRLPAQSRWPHHNGHTEIVRVVAQSATHARGRHRPSVGVGEPYDRQMPRARTSGPAASAAIIRHKASRRAGALAALPGCIVPTMSTVQTWLQLIRVGNVFTAVADILAGALFIGAGRLDAGRVAAASLASALLYSAGIVLNDVFDFRKDSTERPERPLPSRAISLRAAILAGAVMLFAGWSVTIFLSREAAIAGTALALSIVLYDGVLKTTPLAPLVMGTCRGLNLSLGMLAVGVRWEVAHYLAVGLLALYVTSVTFFARREATVASSHRLAIGWLGVGLAVAGLVAVAVRVAPAQDLGTLWPTIVACLALEAALGIPAWRAVRRPEPPHVQAAVKTFILAIILFDAILVLTSRGPLPALAGAALLIPAAWLGRAFRPT